MLGRLVENELDIVDKPKQETGELIAEVGLIFFDECGTRQTRYDRLQGLRCFGPRFLVPKRRNGMRLISRLSRDTIGA